jgi:outer membrane biosynthesis protein TonB
MCDARHTANGPENLSTGGTRGSGGVVFNASRDASEYYAPASLRLGEAGPVVLRFTVDADGKAVEPFTIDAAQSLTSSERLVVAAQEYLEESRFVSRAPYKKMLTASFVFEFAPCGTLNHSLVHDYAISLCRDRPSQPNWPNPGVAVTTPQ